MQSSTVLIIDDSSLDLAVETEALRSEHQVFGVPDVGAALDLIQAGVRPDLIVLDVTMPGEDGFSVCRRLKEQEAIAAVPVIFVTSRDAAEDEEAGFEAGGVDYVTKPINPLLLCARARVHIELKEARERLERQNEELKEVALVREQVEHIARHDLKNPLMVVLNMPAVIKGRGGLPPNQVAALDMIEDAGRRMLEMINRSSDLLKMELGIYALSPARVDALSVARQVTGSLATLARSREVAVELRFAGREARISDVVPVSGEELLLYTMLANLMKNALEASPRESTVTVSFGLGEAVDILVHNRGTLPVNIRGRFFEKYATEGKEGGTGLGAYSARLIAKTMGGTIGFTTSESEGTTIRVTLPRAGGP